MYVARRRFWRRYVFANRRPFPVTVGRGRTPPWGVFHGPEGSGQPERAKPFRLPSADTSPKRGGFYSTPLKGPPLGTALGCCPRKKAPLQGLRSRAPPAADTARRSRGSGRRMQAPRQGARHDARTATRPRMRRRRRLRGSTSRLCSTFRDVPTARSPPALQIIENNSFSFAAFFTKKATQRNSNLSHHFERAAGPRSTIFFIYYLLSFIYSFPLPPGLTTPRRFPYNKTRKEQPRIIFL